MRTPPDPTPTVWSVTGRLTVIAAERAAGGRADEFLTEIDEAVRDRFRAHFDRLAELGSIRNSEIFRPLGNGIYEFKQRTTERVLCFFDPWKHVVLTNGFRGKHGRGKCPPQEIERAERIRENYLSRRRRA